MSRPLQVFLEETELERLEAWSRERGWTKSQAVRAAIRAVTRSAAEDPLLAASGMIYGLPADASERVDHYLEESFFAKKGPGRQKRRRARARLRR